MQKLIRKHHITGLTIYVSTFKQPQYVSDSVKHYIGPCIGDEHK